MCYHFGKQTGFERSCSFSSIAGAVPVLDVEAGEFFIGHLHEHDVENAGGFIPAL